ncbi:unknown [[Mannheimia] succiniciproducens MBEL55E]|uniref:Uncharacterized protein n=1 Tax=Mannheimia succiniciproducens (strain KCTC 0769BP / MBEL55E) TaxID=221988 RepID=Q65RD7_MANSM|nr:unknown [[Mannheimia] succiniciproducens MBEL55E]
MQAPTRRCGGRNGVKWRWCYQNTAKISLPTAVIFSVTFLIKRQLWKNSGFFTTSQDFSAKK